MLSTQLDDYIYDNCRGARCEVMTEQEPLLYIGSFSEYQRVISQAVIRVRGKSIVPQEVLERQPVWVRMRTPENVVILYGKVMEVGPDFYRVKVEEAVLTEERREFFRQRVSGAATVQGGGHRSTQVELVNISLSGISFRCEQDYEVGSELTISEARLVEGGEPYLLRCQVCRAGKPDEAGVRLYGCTLKGVSERDENRLTRDIFKLQTLEIQLASEDDEE